MSEKDIDVINKVVKDAVSDITKIIVPKTKIAVLDIQDIREVGATGNITITDRGWYILDTLTTEIVRTHKYIIVDRNSLNSIRTEQKFQLSGEVSDDRAISIGKFLGATVVVTGAVMIVGKFSYLRIKTLNVETAQVLSMIDERIGKSMKYSSSDRKRAEINDNKDNLMLSSLTDTNSNMVDLQNVTNPIKIATTTDFINIRTKMSVESKSKGIIPSGKSLSVIREMNNGWTEIEYNNIQGYVLSKYLKYK
jgi:hypothetical protein